MKIKKGFVLRQVAEQYVVIATGEASKEFHGMVKLNQVGADIWQGLLDGCTQEEIVNRLTDKYEIDNGKATEDTEKLIRQMEEAGFLYE
jgi:hypothetical protein